MSGNTNNQPTHLSLEAAASPILSRSAHWLRYLVLFLVVTIVAAQPITKVVRLVCSNLFGNEYDLYRSKLELLQLQEANRRMKSELVAVRSLYSRSGKIEESLSERVGKLEKLIDQSVGLGLFKKNNRAQVVAGGEGREGQGSRAGGKLAAILNAPELSSAKGRAAKQPAVGGAEDDCADEKGCDVEMKQDVSMAVEPSASVGAIDMRGDLSSRFDRLISVMSFLPIGFPAVGEISSEFGGRRSPFSHRRSFHHGVDVSLRIGTGIVATGAGVVARVAYNRTYGTLIDIQHMHGLVTRYAHLTKTVVKVGDRVTRGKLIALSGSTGRSTGPHLHYEVIHNGRARDPQPFMRLADRLVGSVQTVTERS